METYTVYMLHNDISKKSYIGYSSAPEKSVISAVLGDIQRKAEAGKTSALANAVREYGIESFSMHILRTVTCSAKEIQAIKVEFIQVMGTSAPNGYNTRNLSKYSKDMPGKSQQMHIKDMFDAEPEPQVSIPESRVSKHSSTKETSSIKGSSDDKGTFITKYGTYTPTEKDINSRVQISFKIRRDVKMKLKLIAISQETTVASILESLVDSYLDTI